MFKRKTTIFLASLLILATILVFGPVPASASVKRLYCESTAVQWGNEITPYWYSNASDDNWYQINTTLWHGKERIEVNMTFSTTLHPATLTQIYVFSEAHVNVTTKKPVNIAIYDYANKVWETCFSVSATSDTHHNYTITANLTNYISAGEMKLRVYYSASPAQIIYQDHTYIELTYVPTAPVADFTYSPPAPYTNETVTFNASASYDPDGTIVSYFWDFDDGTNATGVIVDHAYANDGTYNVTLTVTDNDNLTNSVSKSVTVFNRPPVASFTENATTVLTYEDIYFNASASYDPDGSIVSYFWTFGDGTDATGVVVTHAYADDGTYNVTLTVTDDDGASANFTQTKTVLNRPPVASFWENATAVDTGVVIHFDASGSYDLDGNITSYFWDFGDGTNATDVIVVDHAYADDGTYNVTLTVTDDDGATDTATSTKNISNRPPVASFTQSATTVLTGVNITFDASSSDDPDGVIVSYFWDFGDGTNTTGVIVDHAYADDGTYTVTLTVTDDDGATDTATSLLITVLNRPPVANFTESAETVDTGVVIHFDASGSYDLDGNITSYFWDFGDGTNATGVIVDHAYVDDGTYNVTLTVTDDDGATDTATSSKTVLNRSPVANFTESAETVYTNEAITFNASLSSDPDGTIVSYFWDFGDGTNATDVIVVDHAYADDGTYNVTLTVTDDDGASANFTQTKTVLNRSPVAIFEESAETVLTNEVIYFNATNSYDLDGNITSYFWTFGDGTNATGVLAEHAYTDDGTYTVTLTVTDDDGDIDTVTSSKTVLNRSPVANFTESAETVYTNEAITFNASLSSDPDGTIVSYFWDFGDGTNATGVIVTHAYADDGTYTVTLTVTDDDGASSSVNATKTVLNRSPVANFTWSPDVPLVNQIVTFNASASYDPDGSIVSYFWDFGDGTNTTVSNPIINYTYTIVGDFNVTLTVTDDDGATDLTMGTLTVSGRDVAVLNITVTYPYGATAAYPGWNITVTVTVRNEGPQNETFWVALYYNRTATEWELIGNQTVTDLPALTDKTLTFVWDTTGVSPSIYTFNATASAVPYEVDTADNVLVDGIVWLKIPGDADGDGHVRLSDLTILALNWYKPVIDPSADFDGDGKVQLSDLTILALNWYKI